MTMLDEVFGLTESTNKPQIQLLALNQLVPFDNQPFKLYSKTKLEELAQDIKENGLIHPIIVREKERGKFEILAGHNRVNAMKLNNERQIPAIIRDLNDQEAQLLLVQSNLLQRQSLSNKEKALAYHLKNEAIKSQGIRGSGNSLETLSSGSKDSKRTIARYIKTVNLIPELMEAFDDNEFSLPIAETLAGLTEASQEEIVENVLIQNIKVTQAMVTQFKKADEEGTLTPTLIQHIVNEKKKPSLMTYDDIKESLVKKYDEDIVLSILQELNYLKVLKLKK